MRNVSAISGAPSQACLVGARLHAARRDSRTACAAPAPAPKQQLARERLACTGLPRRTVLCCAQPSQAQSTYLQSISIEDFALVSSQHVEFAPGFNVITGTSGSGKSVLLSAFGIILGAQASRDMVREPAGQAGMHIITAAPLSVN